MAVMGHRKRAIAQGWDAVNRQRTKENQSKEVEEKSISEEEHKKRLEMLKSLGILKDK